MSNHSVPNSLRRWTVTVTVWLLLLLTLFFTAGSLLMTRTDVVTTALEELLQSPDYEIRYRHLQGGWRYFSPHIEMRDLAVYSVSGGKQPDLTIDRLAVTLDAFNSLLQWQPVFRRIDVSRLSLTANRDSKGWRLGSIPFNLGGSSEAPVSDLSAPDRLLSLILQQQEIHFFDSQVLLNFPDGSVSHPPRLTELHLYNQSEQHQLEGQIIVEEQGESKAITLLIDAEGHPGHEGFEARFYLKTPMLEHPFWLPLLVPGYQPLEQLPVAAEIWGLWRGVQQGQGAQLAWLRGGLELPSLDWRREMQGKVQSVRIRNLQSRFLYQSEDSANWSLRLDKLQGQVDDKPLPTGAFSLRFRDGGYELGMDRLTLGSASKLLQGSPFVSPRIKDELKILQPEGELRNLSLQLTPNKNPDDPLRFRLRSDMDRVGVAAWKGAPQLKGVSGLLEVSESGGSVNFESDDFFLYFPQLYRQGWQYTHAKGRVDWSLGKENTRVVSQLLQLEGPSVRAGGRFSLEIPNDFEQQGLLSLMVGMRDTDGTLTPLYVPEKVVSPALFGWLDEAIQAGDLKRGGFVYHGPISNKQRGERVSTQMFFDVARGDVQFQPSWPMAREADTFVMVKDQEALIEVSSGKIFDTEIQHAQIYLPPEQPARVLVEARLKGGAADGRRVLLESPISDYLGDEFAHWALAGSAQTALSLNIPLSGGGAPGVQVVTDLTEGRYSNESLGLEFSSINGKIRYDDKNGLSASALKAHFFDEPVSARIATRQRQDGQHTRVSIEGGLDISRFNRWAGQRVLSQMQGRTSYRAELDICASGPDCSSLRVRSDLKGIEADMPPPYEKMASEIREFDLRTTLGGGEQRLWFAYGNRLQGGFSLLNGVVQGGELLFGNGQGSPQAKSDGLWVRGHLDDVEDQRWITFLQRLFPAADKPSGDLDTPTRGFRIDPFVHKVALTARRLHLAEQEFEDVTAILSRAGRSGWLLAVESSLVRGEVLLPDQVDAPYDVQLDYLRWQSESGSKPGTQEGSDPLAAIDPQTLPAMNLQIDELQVDGENFGRWALQSTPLPSGIRLQAIEGHIRHLDVKAELLWTKAPTGHHTQVDIDVTAVNLAQVLEAWGSPGAIEARSATVKGDLLWDGSPLHFSWPTLSGELSFDARDGRFLETSAAGNALRLLGILNVNTIGRRLRLDFSDLLQEGISFDQVSGRYLINLGVGVSGEPLRVVGPSANFELEGTVDLVDESLNQELTVTLPITDSLPVAAMLLGAPQVAGAVFVIEKLFGDKLKRAAGARYRLYGSWDDPHMDPIIQTEDHPPQRRSRGDK